MRTIEKTQTPIANIHLRMNVRIDFDLVVDIDVGAESTEQKEREPIFAE